MRSFCFISVYKTNIDCSVILSGGDRRAGMNSTEGVIISTTIRLSSQYLINIS